MALDRLIPLLTLAELAAVFVFAATGALVAARKQMDVVAFLWLAVVTGVGGGTVRDLVLDLPVFWVKDATPVVVCCLAAIIVYAVAHLFESNFRLMLWLDAVGLALVSVQGAAKALDAGAGPIVAVAMGVTTAAIGGIIRDVLGNEPSIILRREIYVTAAAVGAALFVAGTSLGLPGIAASAIGFLSAFVIRGLAIARGWAMPGYGLGRRNEEPPR